MPDLIAEFDAVMAPVVSDPRFRRWGGLVLTSCLLGGRRVWTSIREDQPLYPHLFVALVANSGFGKSSTIGGVRDALHGIKAIRIGATHVTMPRLVRELGHVFPDAKGLRGLRADCYALLSDELGALFGDRAHTGDLQTLADIWDMKRVLEKQNVYSEAKGKETKAYDHYMTMFAGAQPAWLAEAMPLGRFQLGFPARCHFILGTTRQQPAFSRSKGGNWEEDLRKALGPTMQQVAALRGAVGWTDDAWDAFTLWATDALTQLDRWTGLMEGYGSRRPEHAAKLALLVACARVHAAIELADWESAVGMLLDAEAHLPEVLAMVGANQARPREDQVVEWVRGRGETREADLRLYMRNFFETHRITQTLEELVNAGLLENTTLDWGSPKRKFKAK